MRGRSWRWSWIAVAWLAAVACVAPAAFAEGPASGYQPQQGPLDIHLDLNFWSLITFGVALAVLWRFAWGPIAQALDARERHIADSVAAAEKAREDGKVMLAEYQRKLDSAVAEAKAIVEEARRDGEHTRQELVTKGQRESQEQLDRALREIQQAKQGALKDLYASAAELAAHVATRVLEREVRADEHRGLVQSVLREMGQEN